jgi:hypothetical protein
LLLGWVRRPCIAIQPVLHKALRERLNTQTNLIYRLIYLKVLLDEHLEDLANGIELVI